MSITGITPPSYSNALPSTGGTNPTWNTAALTLNSGNDVQGINLNSTSGTTMTGSSVGALKVRDEFIKHRRTGFANHGGRCGLLKINR